MRVQRLRRFAACRPPSETSLRQTLGRQPESLTVVSQDADRLRTPAAEDKQASGKRIGVEFLAAELGQRVDSFSAVDGFDCHQNAELRRDLDQAAIISHNVRLKL